MYCSKRCYGNIFYRNERYERKLELNIDVFYLFVILYGMNRRNFLKNTCKVACACAAVSVMSVLQSCEDNIDDTYNSNDAGKMMERLMKTIR